MTALAPAVDLSDRQKLRRTDSPPVDQDSPAVRAPGRHELRHTVPQAPTVRAKSLPRQAPAADPGDPTALCCAVAHAATEVLRGVRPLAQLVRSVSPEVYDQLEVLAQVRAAARGRRGAPPTPQSRSRVRRARVVRVAPDAAEATVVIDDVDRVRAAALRVELHRGRWRVVVLEIG